MRTVLLNDIRKAALLHSAGVVFETGLHPVRGKIGELTFSIENVEELQIIEEIFLAGTYNFDLGGPLVIVDIGMNVAFTALYFAAMHPQAIVSAYEPFLPTFRRAEGNIALNAALMGRINTHPFGLSDKDSVIDVEYSNRWRGSAGVYGIPPGLRKKGEVKLEKCELRDAEVELRSVYNKYPDRRVVLKIDCEGSEYDVLTHLADTRMFDPIDLMMIECHRRAPEHDPVALRALLGSQGFGWVHHQPDSPDISTLYAFRKVGTYTPARADGLASREPCAPV
jgi:FkbM family methyltransferase